MSDYRLRGEESGIQVVERLREEFNAAIPALIVTGDTRPDRLREAQASGLHILYKPLNPSRLRALIASLAVRAGAVTSTGQQSHALRGENRLRAVDDAKRFEDGGDVRLDGLLG